MAQPLPQIDLQKCTGCGRCVEACPENVLELQQGKAVIIWPDRCTYCGDCEEICPTHAIALPFEIVVLLPVESNNDSTNKHIRR